METMTGDTIKALDQAIEAGDAPHFNEAYARLTVGCNGCHAALNHAYVVIKEPDQSAFLNQDFRRDRAPTIDSEFFPALLKRAGSFACLPGSPIGEVLARKCGIQGYFL
jgi:hypothetical protein